MLRSRVSFIVIVCAFFVSVVVGHTFAEGASQAPAKSQATKSPTTDEKPVLGGYCVSSYLIDRKAVKGDPKFRTIFRGQLYYHASAARKKAFDEDPTKYLPQFDGLCTAALGGPYGTRLPSDPRAFAIRNDRLYMFSSTRAMRVYLKDPPHYIRDAEQRFNIPDFDGYCPVSYLLHGRAIKGNIRHPAVYRGHVYRFVDSPSLHLFNQDPEKYLPQYEGFCPVSLADRKQVKGDPLVFLVEDGKTYLFADEAARDKFKGNPS